MPLFLLDIIGHARVKLNDHLMFTFAGMDSKAIAQTFFDRKFLRPRKYLSGAPQMLNTDRNKSANVFAQMIKSEQKPFAVDVGQMIWVDDALFGLFLAGFAVGQFQLLSRGGSFGQCIKNLQVDDRLGARPERDGLLDISQIE